MASYRKLIGTLIGCLVAALTWLIAVQVDPTLWQTWVTFILFFLPSVATYFSPANTTQQTPVVATPQPPPV